MTSINSKASSDKRAIEGAVHTMHAEIDDMLHQAKSSEEKAKKAMVDAGRLADELRAEQDHVTAQSKSKRALETQLVELENKCADANEMAIRTGRAVMAKLETRRTKIGCQSWPPSCNRRSRLTRSRSKKLRRSL